MKKWLLLILFILFGCSHYYVGRMECRHEAVVSALIAQEKYPVRIAFGTVIGDESGVVWHAQAQAFVDGEWRWLHLRGDYVVIADKDKGWREENFWSVKDFCKLFSIIY